MKTHSQIEIPSEELFMNNPKKFSALTAIAGLVATALVAVASPASAESGAAFVKRTATYYMDRTVSDAGTVVTHAGDSLRLSFEANLKTSALNSFSSGDVLNLVPNVTSTGTFTSINSYVSINYSAGSNGQDSENGENPTASVTFPATPTYVNVFVSINAYASTEGTITFNPQVKKGDVALNSSTDLNIQAKSATRTNNGVGSTSVTAAAEDTNLNYMFKGMCIATTGLAENDTLTLTAALSDGESNNLGTIGNANWAKFQPGDMPMSTNSGSTYTVPAITAGDVIQINAELSVTGVTANKQYSIADYKVTKGGTELPLIGCDTTNATVTSAVYTSPRLLVTVNTATDTRTAGGMTSNKYMQYSCVLYAAGDSAHNTVIASGMGYGMGMTYSSVGCSIFSPPAGTYTVGVRGLSWSMASNEVFSNTTVTVGGAPAKTNPTFPKIASKVKKGKSITMALSSTRGTTTAGKTAQGLVAKVTSTTKKICTVATVKNKSKKITGYSVKGVAKGTCKITVAITGNASFNTQSKVLTISVTK